MIKIIDKNLKQYKADLHSHTNCSDGEYSPFESKQIYLENNFQVVAFTDHDIFLTHNELTDDNFIALNGFELCVSSLIGTNDVDGVKQVHINFVAKNSDNNYMPFFNPNYVFQKNAKKYIETINNNGVFEERLNTPTWINKAIKTGNELGFLVTYNHPSWSLAEPKDYLALDNLFAMELWNTGSWGILNEDFTPYKEMIFSGKKIRCLATNDFHTLGNGNYNHLKGATYICTNDFTYNGIVKALENGNFYSSSGPTIQSMYIENNKLYVECSEVKKACLLGYSSNIKGVFAEKNNLLTKLEFNLLEYYDKMFMLVIEDEYGNKAYTNPVFNYKDLL